MNLHYRHKPSAPATLYSPEVAADYYALNPWRKGDILHRKHDEADRVAEMFRKNLMLSLPARYQRLTK